MLRGAFQIVLPERRPDAMDALGLILGDVSPAELVARYWDVCSKVFPGPPGRFSELFDWDELVSMLDGHQADLAGRLRLVQNGRTLSQEQIALPAGRSLVGGLTRLSTARINELCAG